MEHRHPVGILVRSFANFTLYLQKATLLGIES